METLRRIRTMRGMTQADLARASGVAQNTISQIEAGNRTPHGATLRKLAAVLGVEVTDFYVESSVPLGGRPAWALDMALAHGRERVELHNADRQREAATGVALVQRADDFRDPPEEVAIVEGQARRAWVADVLRAKRRIHRELGELGVLDRAAELMALGALGAAVGTDTREPYENAVRLNAALVEMWGFLPEEEARLAESAHASVEKEYRRLVFGPTIQGDQTA